MCDVHLCDNALAKMAEAGPLISILAMPEKVIHLATCKECSEKFGHILELVSMEVEPGKVS